MKIGIIGLGDIAQKAYMPVVTRLGHDLVVCSRNAETVTRVAKEYRITEFCLDYKQLLDYQVEAVFIHTATTSHYDIVHFFLENKVHVYVDKPISDKLEETIELYELALEMDLVLMVGFNRRYSPRVQDWMQLEKPDLLVVQKNRHNHAGDIRSFIYDDFIHVIDTLLYLFKGQELEFDYNGKLVDGQLQHMALILQGKGATAFGTMNRTSGKKEERVEYSTPNQKQVLLDMDQLEVFEGNTHKVVTYDDWTPVLERRGFVQAISNFLSWTQTPEASRTELELALRTHEVCEYLVMEMTEQAERDAQEASE